MNSRPPLLNGPRSALLPTLPLPTVEPLTWERVFPLLPPDVQAQLLAGTNTNSLSAHSLKPEGFLARWLKADPKALPATQPQPCPVALDSAWECHAVSAALGATELFLIDCESGPTQWKLASILAANQCQRGRVLILTASGSEADEILHRVQYQTQAMLARAVAPMEDLTRLPATSSKLTAQAHSQQVLHQAQQRVRGNLANLEQRLNQLTQAQALLPQLHEHHLRQTELQHQLNVLDHLPPDADTPEKLQERHAAELQEIDDKLTEQRQAVELLKQRIQKAEQELAHAKTQRSGLTGVFRSLFGNNGPNTAQLEADLQAKQTQLTTISLSVTLLEQGRPNLLERHTQELTELNARRQAAATNLAQQREALTGQLQQLQTQTHQVKTRLQQIGLTDQAEAAQQLKSLIAKTQAERDLASQWMKQLSESRQEIATALLQAPQVVVAPFAAFNNDPLLTNTSRFNVALVLGSDQREEADLQAISQKADKLILLGDLTNLNRNSPSTPRPYLNGNSKPTPNNTRGQAFRKLWNHLHTEYWTEDERGLVAQLVKLDLPERAALVCEPLADRPEIEVRFLKLPTGELKVAELVFPPGTDATEAKALLASELNECRLTPCGPAVWHQEPEKIQVCWPTAKPQPDSEWIDLEPGVRELCHANGAGTITLALNFDPQQGWTHEAAQNWLETRWSLGQTARLPRPVQLTESTATRPALARAAGGSV